MNTDPVHLVFCIPYSVNLFLVSKLLFLLQLHPSKSLKFIGTPLSGIESSAVSTGIPEENAIRLESARPGKRYHPKPQSKSFLHEFVYGKILLASPPCETTYSED
jgi:hypothetical protein